MVKYGFFNIIINRAGIKQVLYGKPKWRRQNEREFQRVESERWIRKAADRGEKLLSLERPRSSSSSIRTGTSTFNIRHSHDECRNNGQKC